MCYPTRQLFFTAFLTMLLGAGLHFLYSWYPNGATALFSPVCESIWEHIKLLFWPYLLAALWLNRDRPGGTRPWYLSLLLICAIMLLLGYCYHILFGGQAMWVDVLLYVLLMVLGFWLPTRFSGPFDGPWWLIPPLLTVLLAAALLVFTLWPPHLLLFTDLSPANAWYSLPC